MKITKLNVSGMHCHACEEIIKDSVSELKGILSVEADSKNNFVIVSYDETKVDLPKIKQVIKKENFEVV